MDSVNVLSRFNVILNIIQLRYDFGKQQQLAKKEKTDSKLKIAHVAGEFLISGAMTPRASSWSFGFQVLSDNLSFNVISVLLKLVTVFQTYLCAFLTLCTNNPTKPFVVIARKKRELPEKFRIVKMLRVFVSKVYQKLPKMIDL